MTRISVCIATFNGENYIRDQLTSILPQLSSEDEIIISDDLSTDRTIENVKSLGDPRIVIIKNDGPRNPTSNFENALRNSKGQYIFLADQDDVWLENKVSVCLEILTSYDLVLTDCVVVDDNLNSINRSYFALINSKPGIIRNLTKKNSYIGCCMAFSREVLEKALPFPKRIPMHDFWIGMVAEFFFTVFFLNERLVLYRRHSGNASPTTGKSSNSIFTKIGFRCQIVWAITQRLLS